MGAGLATFGHLAWPRTPGLASLGCGVSFVVWVVTYFRSGSDARAVCS
jgi:hypothetical protein